MKSKAVRKKGNTHEDIEDEVSKICADGHIASLLTAQPYNNKINEILLF